MTKNFFYNLKFYLAFILSIIALLVINSSCSLERKLTNECNVRLNVIDTLNGSAVLCIECDSLKSSLINRIDKKYKK